MSKILQSTIAASTFIAAESLAEKNAPWTCNQLQNATEPFYRMFPATLGSAKMDDDSSLVISGREGHCFMDI